MRKRGRKKEPYAEAAPEKGGRAAPWGQEGQEEDGGKETQTNTKRLLKKEDISKKRGDVRNLAAKKPFCPAQGQRGRFRRGGETFAAPGPKAETCFPPSWGRGTRTAGGCFHL